MKKKSKIFGSILVLCFMSIVWSVVTNAPYTLQVQQVEPTIANPDTAIRAFQRWQVAKLSSAQPDALVLGLYFSRARSTRHTQAQGQAVIDLKLGTVSIKVAGLPQTERHEVWLIDEASVGEKTLKLGELSNGPYGALDVKLDPDQVRGYKLNRLVITKMGEGSAKSGLLYGEPSLFQRLYFADRFGLNSANGSTVSANNSVFQALMPATAHAAGNTTDAELTALIAQGEQLFFTETFAGNGRTCGTCHRADNNFTIDPTYIASLPSSDPLFIAETNPDLAELENPQLMRQFGLILTNLDGFEDPANKFVMRSVSHILGMAVSIQSDTTEAPFDRIGWSGDGAPGAGRLRDFATGAVTQHFTQTLDRIEGVDFRLPTQVELDALEAFMLSLGRPTDFDISSMVLANATAERGRGFFLTTDSADGPSAAKCQLCHQNAGAFTANDAGKIFNGNFDTGIEAHTRSIDPVEEHAAITAGHIMPVDGGFGTEEDPDTGSFGNGQFNAQSLWEAADTGPFFHNNLAATLEDAVRHYASNEFKNSPEGFFLRSRDTAAADIEVETDDIAAFLRVLNALENIRSATDYLQRAKLGATDEINNKRLTLANAEVTDAVEVLIASDLHAEDAVPELESTQTEIDNALAAVDEATRSTAIDDAIASLASARDLMVVVEPVALTPPKPAEPQPASPDMNGDGVINFLDLGMLKSLFFTSDPRADFNADGVVNFLDLGIMKSLFFTTTTPVDPTDLIPPGVDIDAPVINDTILGSVTVNASATDNVGVTKVVFRVGSTVLGQALAPPYSVTWHTQSFSNGTHILEATASDAAGNTSVKTVTVIVDNPPCTSIYGCAPGAPPPPPTPKVPVPSSLDSLPEFKGFVRGKDMDLSTLTIEEIVTDPVTGLSTPTGVIRTFIVHSDTVFNSDFAQNLLHVLVGHRVEGKFISTSTGKEIASIEVSLANG